MKKNILIALILFSAACKKDSSLGINSKLIVKVTVNGKTDQSFEYDESKRLIKENYYGVCTTDPQDEYFYTYKDNRLDKVRSVIRSLYSSMEAACNPSSGLHHEEIFSYDNTGRINRIARAGSVTDYIYNQQGFIEKTIFTGGVNKFIYEYAYDSKGNVIKETDPQGNITEYAYDKSINPFYRHKRGTFTPFTLSPNNIIRARGSRNYIRDFKYSSNGLPIQVMEDNGLTYTYFYSN